MSFDIRVVAYQPAAGRIGPIETLSISTTLAFCDAATMSAKVTEPVLNALPDMVELAIEYWNDETQLWVEPDDARFIAKEGDSDAKDPAGVHTLTGVSFWMWMLSKNVVATGAAIDPAYPDGERPFIDATPGAIMKTFLDEAHLRGWGAFLTFDFTHDADSEGVAWADAYTIAYRPGITAWLVLSNLADQAIVEFSTSGRTLHMFRPDHSIDKSVGNAPTRIGNAATNMPVKTSIDDLITDVTVFGDSNLSWDFTNGATNPLGRLEGSIQQGGVSRPGTAAKMAASTLTDGSEVKRQITATEDALTTASLPFIDYISGEWVLARVENANESLRVMEVQLSKGKSITIDVTLNDRFIDLLARTAKRANGILGGSTAGGTGVPPNSSDTRIAKAPLGVLATSEGYWTPDGLTESSLAVRWVAVTQGSDSVDMNITDYELWWRPKGAPFDGESLLGSVRSATFGSNGYTPGDEYLIRVRAVSDAGTKGLFSGDAAVTMAQPTGVLPQPTPPIVTSKRGTIIIDWDGHLTSGGTIFDPTGAFSYVYPEISIAEGGPYAGIGQPIQRPGLSAVITDRPIGATLWVHLIAVDRRGVPSFSSDPVSVVVIGTDLGSLAPDVKDAIAAAEQAGLDGQAAAGDASAAASTAAADAARAVQDAANASDTAGAAQQAAAQAAEDAATASGIAAGKSKTIFSTTAPTGADAAATTLWIDLSGTPPNNTPNRWDGQAWVVVTDGLATAAASVALTAYQAAGNAVQRAEQANTAAAAAQAAAESASGSAAVAQASADGKAVITYSDQDPQYGGHFGDTWFRRGTNGVITAQWECLPNGTPDAATSSKLVDGVPFTNLATNPRVQDLTGWASNAAGALSLIANRFGPGLNAARVTRVTTAALDVYCTMGAALTPVKPSTTYTIVVLVAASATVGVVTAARPNPSSTAGSVAGPGINLNAVTGTKELRFTTKTGATQTTLGLTLQPNTFLPVGGTFDVGEAMIVEGNYTGPYFDGTTPNAWWGTPNWVPKTLDNAVIANLDAGKLTAGTIDVDRLGARSIAAGKLIAGTITAAELDADSVTAVKIKAGEVTAGKLAADAVVASNIKAGEVTAGKLAADAVVAANIKAGSITGDKLDVGAVTATKIDANAIDGKTITGALIRSSAEGARTEMNAEGLRVLDASNVEQVKLGYGVDTGMLIRNPRTDKLVPLSRSVFGNFGYAWSGSSAIAKPSSVYTPGAYLGTAVVQASAPTYFNVGETVGGGVGVTVLGASCVITVSNEIVAKVTAAISAQFVMSAVLAVELVKSDGTVFSRSNLGSKAAVVFDGPYYTGGSTTFRTGPLTIVPAVFVPYGNATEAYTMRFVTLLSFSLNMSTPSDKAYYLNQLPSAIVSNVNASFFQV